MVPPFTFLLPPPSSVEYSFLSLSSLQRINKWSTSRNVGHKGTRSAFPREKFFFFYSINKKLVPSPGERQICSVQIMSMHKYEHFFASNWTFLV